MPKPPTPDNRSATLAPRSLMRRQLLRASVAASAASLLGSCMNGSEDSAPPLLGSLPPPYMPGIANLVVVMMENRSFDNLLGYLYGDDLVQLPAQWPAQVKLPYQLPAGKSFEGLWQFKGGAGPCIGTQGCNTDPGGKVFVHPHDFAPDSMSAADWSHPNPNPGEGLVDTSEQLASGTMNGFVLNYAAEVSKPGHTGTDTASIIMGAYTPMQVKVLAELAHEFAVFDHWFSAVPSETYCNRSFFHASTSSGYVQNAPTEKEKQQVPPLTEHAKWAKNTADTVFDRLSATTDPSTNLPVTWSVYASRNDNYPTGLTAFIHQRVSSKFKCNFKPLESFCSDVVAGRLPRYSFIETLYGGSEDFHPPQDIRGGEEVLRQVYETIRNSGASGHDYTRDTMILIVFDEHGGTYDHVVPGKALAPDHTGAAPDSTFDFKSLGVRVPAVAISSYTAKNTIVNTTVNHAALIRTLALKHGFEGLDTRDKDASAGDLSLACNLTVPRAQGDWPKLTTSVSPKPINICGVPGTGTCTSP